MIIARFIAQLARSRWIKTLFGVALLAALVWFFGPLIGIGQLHPFDSVIVRLIVIAALLALWLAINLMHVLAAHRKEAALAQDVSASETDPAERVAAEELALLGERLRAALATLRRAKLGGRRGRLYELPWYLFIGPPGAGKTTALRHCGLSFPLADKDGAAPVRGVGGTRHCDWWFTDQAVLIDTAGRYTTQDSEEAVDAKAWLGFLRLLKKYRGRQPLNGVIVAISIADLAQAGEAERGDHARAVRRRLRELGEELRVRIPIYVVFTKADLLRGFIEFFEALGREERDQVWGMTFALDDGTDEAGAVAAYGGEFDALLARLDERLLERLQQETDPQRRREIFGFPQQLASIRALSSEFLDAAFRPSRLEPRSLLRGVYFASGTQDGTPIDRLLSAMAGQFALPRQAVTGYSRQGRAYFLGKLVREVIFGEASLVGRDPRLERRTRWTYRGVYAGSALGVIGLSGLWTQSYIGNGAMMADVHKESLTYRTQLEAVTRLGPDDTALPPVLPPLGTLRTLRGGYEQQQNAPPLSLTWGLWQGEKIASAAVDAYYRALDSLLIPRLLARLEQQMQANLGKPEFLYTALKVYLILGRRGPLDKDLVLQWMGLDFASSFPGEEGKPIADALLAHMEARLQRPLAPIGLNGPLITEVRGILTRQPAAEYSYNRIVRAAQVQKLPAWTVADNAGPGAARVFTLRSGQGLDHGVPGIFTWEGYHQVMLPLLPTVTQDVAEDGWVLGRGGGGGLQVVREANRLRREVLGLYLDDYTRRWDAMIADVAMKPFGSVQEALDTLSLISAPVSPFRDLMLAIDRQTQLSRAAATDAAESKAESKAAAVGQRAAGLATIQARMGLTFQQAEIANILSDAFGAAPNGKPVDPASRVDDHFKWMHNFVAGGDGKQPPLEQAITNISQLYQGFNQTAGAPNQAVALLHAATTTSGAAGAAAQLDALSRDMPKPIGAMLHTVAASSSGIASGGAAQALEDAWRNKVLPLCQKAFERYPFLPESKLEVPPDDFAALLKPGGLMDQFFDQYLKPIVDQTSEPWRWQGTEGTPLTLAPDSVVAFQRAAEIRDALFANGPTISLRFQLTPARLDPEIARVSMDLGGQTLTYDHGPIQSMQFQWPGSGGNTLSRLTLTPADGGNATVETFDGTWALLRLIDAGRLESSGQPDKFGLSFSSRHGGTAAFVLEASSVHNPFNGALRAFRCPPRL